MGEIRIVPTFEKPIFVISLDMELAWGFLLYPDHKVLKAMQTDPIASRQATVTLLRLFETFEIPATWAVVGNLFHDTDCSNDDSFLHLPQFTEGWITKDFYSSIRNNPLYHARDLVEKIISNRVKHEIGIHSFFHIPFSRCSTEVANSEVEQSLSAAKKFGVAPRSFVFPENAIGHLDVLANHGFTIYRGKDAIQPDSSNPIIAKLNGAYNKLIAPPILPIWQDGIWKIPGSMCFADQQMPFTVLPKANSGLRRALRVHKVFHIWLHPWNLFVIKNLEHDLSVFLSRIARKRDAGMLDVMTMDMLATRLTNTTVRSRG